MDESPENRIIRRRDVTRRRLHALPAPAPPETVEIAGLDGEGPARPRSIGRLIAQTALLADSALTRTRHRDTDRPVLPHADGPRGRRFGWRF